MQGKRAIVCGIDPGNTQMTKHDGTEIDAVVVTLGSFDQKTCNHFSCMLTCNTNWRCLHVSILVFRIFHPAVPLCQSVPARHPTALCADRPYHIPRMVLCPLRTCQRHLVCHAGAGSGLVVHNHHSQNTGNIVLILLAGEFWFLCFGL